MKQRTELTKVSSQLANIEIGSAEVDNVPEDSRAVKQLQDKTERIKKELRSQAEASFVILRTPEGRVSNGQKKIFHIFVLQSSKKERFLCQKDTVLQI